MLQVSQLAGLEVPTAGNSTTYLEASDGGILAYNPALGEVNFEVLPVAFPLGQVCC